MPARTFFSTMLRPLLGITLSMALLSLGQAQAVGDSQKAGPSYRLFPQAYFIGPQGASGQAPAQGGQVPAGQALKPGPLHGPYLHELDPGVSPDAEDGPEEDDAALELAKAQEKAEVLQRIPLLAGNQVIAFYGKPGAVNMGILGEYSKEQLAPLLEAYAKLYDDANGSLGVIPAFHIVYGTVWPEGEIGLLNKRITEEYIRFAAERGWVVILDHQIGRYAVAEAVRAMLPFLHHPNVHLAIDPEWRTLVPMKEIGSISGAELNEAQSIVDEYLREQKLPGIRMLVVHQFVAKMIVQRETVRATFDRVLLVHNADGFGSPDLKRHSYRFNAQATNMPVKGFKLFFEAKLPAAGSDRPLMKPEEVLALDPMPLLIMYQ
jgi:hypothetical protein